jgi:ribosomal protein S18 acetylase RimI-like enzyme
MLEFTASSGTNVKIRHAELDDAPSLQRNCLSANTIDEVRRFLEKDVEEMERGNKARLVADVEGEVIGNLEIFFSRHSLSYHTAGISTVVVNPRYRRRGIAMKLVESALKIAKETNIEIVKIDVEAKNTPAVKLYTEAGFKQYGRLERGIIRKGEYDDLILLKKDL